jgi:hypothetical protein
MAEKASWDPAMGKKRLDLEWKIKNQPDYY